MAVTTSTYYWKCDACFQYGVFENQIDADAEARAHAIHYDAIPECPGTIEIGPVMQQPFDAGAWVLVKCRPTRSGRKWALFGAGLPDAAMDQLSIFLYDTRKDAAEAAKKALESAYQDGWRPV